MKLPVRVAEFFDKPAVRKVTGFLRWISRKRWVRMTTGTLATLVVLLGGVVWWNTRDIPGPQGEVFLPNEDVEIAKMVSSSMTLMTQDHDERLQANKGDTYKRGVHGATPGCVKAVFTVLKNAQNFSYGLFAAERRYEAWIRFSNGNHQLKADTEKDVRGFAIKVMGVSGRKLLEGEENATTQDFVMMNVPTYFFREPEPYAQFTTMLSWGATNESGRWLRFLPGMWDFRPAGVQGRDTVPFFRYSWNPANWNIRSLIGAGHAQVPPPPSPLRMQYYSASAYRLGSQQYAKYSVRPCRADYMNAPKVDTPTGLHDALKKTLSADTWCFDFMVQLQVPGKNMPVEDASVEWQEKDSPFVKVARIDIPKQDIDAPGLQCFCENLAYNPWHSLPEHKPVGIFNRARKAVYQEGARFRRAHGGAPQREPEGNNWALDPPCLEPAAPVTTATLATKP